jgi:long-chain acyl-CoA synthetase
MTVVPRLVEKVYDKIYNTGASAGGLKTKIFLWALSLVEDYDLGKNLGIKDGLQTNWFSNGEKV